MGDTIKEVCTLHIGSVYSNVHVCMVGKHQDMTPNDH